MQSTQAKIRWDDVHARNRKLTDLINMHNQPGTCSMQSLARKYNPENIAVSVHQITITKGSRFDRAWVPLRVMLTPLFLLMGAMMRPITKEDRAQAIHCLLSEEALAHHEVTPRKQG